jgi:hypothetical protein
VSILDKLRGFLGRPEQERERERREARAPDVPPGNPLEVAGAAEVDRPDEEADQAAAKP